MLRCCLGWRRNLLKQMRIRTLFRVILRRIDHLNRKRLAQIKHALSF